MYSTEEAEKKMKLITEEIEADGNSRMNSLLAPEPLACDIEMMAAHIRFKGQEWEKNQRGEIHGGVISSMFDIAMGMTVLTYSSYEEISTADINVSFIRPFTGTAFIFNTEIVNLGRMLVRVRAKAYDEDSGKCLASASANFVPFKKRA